MTRTAEFKLHAEKSAGFTSNTVSTVGDEPGHEFSQRVFSLFVTSDHPDFNGFYTTNYVQADEVNGNGSFWGYARWPLVSGETVWIKFKSLTRREALADGTWQASFDGTLEFVSGTGKYESIAGTAAYLGKASLAGSYWDASVRLTY